jgi:uncharacterized protein (TIGR00269 family)
MKCDKCNDRSIIFQRYSGMHLCYSHFEGDVNRKVREVLRKSNLFGKGAKLVVALDGCKNSSVQLYILKNLFASRRDLEITAILIDEGISDYRSNSLANARSLSDHLGVPHVTRSYKDYFQITVDEMASEDISKSLCTFCRSMKMALLNRTALEVGATVLASGQTLDDEAETIMKCYLQGDIEDIFRIFPKRPPRGMVHVVKPLSRVPKKEVSLYAVTHELVNNKSSYCPYIGQPIWREVKGMLCDFEGKHPGTNYSLLRSGERISDLRL